MEISIFKGFSKDFMQIHSRFHGIYTYFKHVLSMSSFKYVLCEPGFTRGLDHTILDATCVTCEIRNVCVL